MSLLKNIRNRIQGIRQYSLKTVSIVVVATLLSMTCFAGCGAGSGTDTADCSISGSEAAGAEGKNGYSNDIDGGIGDGIGVDNDDSIGYDNSVVGGDESAEESTEQNVEETAAYGEVPVTIAANYQWQCEGEEEYMYLLTNPNINVALRGAGLDTDISVSSGTTCVATIIVPIYLCKGDTLSFSAVAGMSRRIFYAELDRDNCVYTCTYAADWKDMTGETITIPYDTYLMIDYSFSDISTDDMTDIDKSNIMTADKLAELESASYIFRNSDIAVYENLYADNDALIAEIEVTEARSREGNPYILVKIPSELSNGQQVMPELQQTSWMEYYAYPTYDKLTSNDARILFRSVLSPMMYARVYHTAFTINAGLFNIFSNTPQGQTIIDGAVVTNNPMKDDIGDPISPDTECYAMTIDAAGILDYAKHDDGTPFRTIDANSLITDGIRDAITGWGCIVYDGKSVVELNPSAVTSSTIFYEQVHKRKVAHQVIGQDPAGNYYILSTNDIDSGYGFGLNYDEAAEIMIAAGATFAYMLDGGDSVATVINGEQLTTVYYEDYGKPVPTVINFVAK